MRAEVHLPDSVEAKRTSDQERYHRTQKFIALAAWLAFGTAAIYAALSYSIWKEMVSQTDIASIAARQGRQEAARAARDSQDASNRANVQLGIAQKQATSAQNSVDAIKRNIEVQERAWVGLGAPTTVTAIAITDKRLNITFGLTFKNFGKSPALRMMGGAITVTESSA